MTITGQSDWEKGEVKIVKIEVEGNSGQEVTVRHETVPQTKEKSTWSWHEEFAVEWSEIFITKKRKRDPRIGE
jgi:hypothetical protein